MEIVVNDTNILIDLYNAGLLRYCGQLGLDFRTLDVVMNEIVAEEQKRAVLALVDKGFLKVHSLSGEQVAEVFGMVASYRGVCNLSSVDVSVLVYAKRCKCRLLTGDKTLRDKASTENVVVSGILYITDLMTSRNIISTTEMITALERLLRSNSRLPQRLIQERISELHQAESILK